MTVIFSVLFQFYIMLWESLKADRVKSLTGYNFVVVSQFVIDRLHNNTRLIVLSYYVEFELLFTIGEVEWF